MLRSCLVLFAVFTIVTGMAYPAVVTLFGQVVCPQRANGRLIERDGRVVGSALIGQHFGDPGYFWGRPSATAASPYDADASAGSNLGPSNPALTDALRGRIELLRENDPAVQGALVPVDLVTASGSGLDPHLSPAGAYYQVGRVARARDLDEHAVRALVADHVERPFLGEPVVNLLLLNLALDEQAARMAGS